MQSLQRGNERDLSARPELSGPEKYFSYRIVWINLKVVEDIRKLLIRGSRKLDQPVPVQVRKHLQPGS
jgi:hypothetical protein